MLRRKVIEQLEQWKSQKTSQGLLVMGVRQCGKTTAIREFARKHYEAIAEVNFYEDRRAVETVNAAMDARDLFMRISALSGTEIIPGRTLVFLDEIQECEDLLTWLKFLVQRDDCDYILSGSLLGLDSFHPRSLPVGFLSTITMYPLDFEEFCWGMGIGPSLTSAVRQAFQSRATVPAYLHERLIDLFYRYLLVGGMPDVVQSFVDSSDLVRVRRMQRDIISLYEADMTKYVRDRTERRQIRMVYESIPSQLNQENKRFRYTQLGKNLRFANLETAFDWLGHAGVAIPVTRVTEPTFPLMASEQQGMLKLYSSDVGLLTAQLMGDVDVEILNRRSSMNYGSIFENVAAQEFVASGHAPLHYYRTAKVGEIDFVLQERGTILLCEIKSGKDYRRHSALSNLLATQNYGFGGVYVFCEDNTSVEGDVTYLPIYMLGLV